VLFSARATTQITKAAALICKPRFAVYTYYSGRYQFEKFFLKLDAAEVPVLTLIAAKKCTNYQILSVDGSALETSARAGTKISVDGTRITCGPSSWFLPTKTEFCTESVKSLSICGGTNNWIKDLVCNGGKLGDDLARYSTTTTAPCEACLSCDLLETTAFRDPGIYQVDISQNREVDKPVSFLHEFTIDVKDSSKRVIVQGFRGEYNAYWWIKATGINPKAFTAPAQALLTKRASYGEGIQISNTDWTTFKTALKSFCAAGTYGTAFNNQDKSGALWNALPLMPGYKNNDGLLEPIVLWVRKLKGCDGVLGGRILKHLSGATATFMTDDHPSLGMVKAAWDVCSSERTTMNNMM